MALSPIADEQPFQQLHIAPAIRRLGIERTPIQFGMDDAERVERAKTAHRTEIALARCRLADAAAANQCPHQGIAGQPLQRFLCAQGLREFFPGNFPPGGFRASAQLVTSRHQFLQSSPNLFPTRFTVLSVSSWHGRGPASMGSSPAHRNIATSHRVFPAASHNCGFR